MKSYSHYLGHEIYNAGGRDWRYSDDDQPLNKENPRFCNQCNRPPTPEGHDPCLGTLPGVKNACCGHGVHRGYIQFENGVIIRFEKAAIDWPRETHPIYASTKTQKSRE